MADDIDLQISVLRRLWMRMLGEAVPSITVAELKAYATGAAAVMVDGTEVIMVSQDGGSTSAAVHYPKYVVMAAALDVLDHADDVADGANVGGDRDVTHFDLSRGRIET